MACISGPFQKSSDSHCGRCGRQQNLNPAGTIAGELKGTVQAGEILTPSFDKSFMVLLWVKATDMLHLVDLRYLTRVIGIYPEYWEVVHVQPVNPHLIHVADDVAVLCSFEKSVRYHVLGRHMYHTTSALEV